MNAKTLKLPGADHPITIELSHSRVVVSVAKIEIVNSRDALILREASYPPVLYIPRPYAAVAEIQGHLAFYRDRVDSMTVAADSSP